MMPSIALYHHAKNKKVLMTGLGENVQKPQFLTLSPLNPRIKIFPTYDTTLK